MSQVLRHLPEFKDDNLLVGFDKSDDAAVYRINDETAIIQTLDFFTPIVDDPYLFGQIAATNALSDVYAMGGRPVIAMNIVGFPKYLDISILGEILRGGADKVKEAGALLIGGHSIEDDEPKYGLSVTGFVHPKRVLTNSGARPGDVLILTKPVGSGILSTAIKADLLDPETVDRAVSVMNTLNRTAAEGMEQVSVNACTDVTGFGLMGHAFEMAKGSDATLVIEAEKVPVIEGTFDMASMGIIPGGAYKNMGFVGENARFAESVTLDRQNILYDPQTSGGLLISLPEADAANLMEIFEKTLDLPFARIGRVKEKGDALIEVV